MSELVTTVKPGMPEGYGFIKEIEIKRSSDGSLRYNGIIEFGEGDNVTQRRVQLPPLETIWGHSSTLYEEYKNDPENWVPPNAAEGAPPAMAAGAATAVPPAADVRREAVAEEPAPTTDRRAEVVEEAPPRERIIARATTTRDEVEESEYEPVRDRNVGRWARIREKVGGTVLGWQVKAHNGLYRVYDRRGNYREVDEDEVEEYYESERRAGGIALLGGLAVLGAGIVIGYLLHKGGHSVHEYKEFTGNYKIPPDQYNGLVDRIDEIKSAVENDHAQEMQKLNEVAGQVNADKLLDEKNHDLLQHIHQNLHRINGAPDIDLSNFRSNSFYGQTPHQAVSNMFDVIRDNNIQVRGVNSHRIDQIVNSMMRDNWQIASGMKAGNHQNIVDVASDWADGRTGNWRASGLQGMEKSNGSSVDAWQNFMRLAARHGVRFSA